MTDTGPDTYPPNAPIHSLRWALEPEAAAPAWLGAAQPSEFGALLKGAFDVHVHGQPDLSASFANRGADLAVIRLAKQYGISGWVLKSHLWPTTDRAHLLDQLVGDDFRVLGSFTLNPVLGPPSATTVELAAAHGASVIFLPTWGARADVGRNGYISQLLRRTAPSFDRFADQHAISLTDGNGTLTGSARDVLDAVAGLGLSLGTGHVGLAESRAIAEYCADIGFQRLMITHPLHYVEHPRELREFTDTGALVEFAAATLMHPDGHMHVRDVAAAIAELGPDQLVISSDVFSRWAPPQPECLRIVAEQLNYLGIPAGDLHRMLAINPRRFLGQEQMHHE